MTTQLGVANHATQISVLVWGGGIFHFDATYFKIPGGKFVPQITVLIEKAPGAENIEVKELMPRPPKEGSK